MESSLNPNPDPVASASREQTVDACEPEAVTLSFDYPGLRALIERKVKDPELAADLLQEAVLTALHKLRCGAIERPEHLGGYIYRVALNHLRNFRRKDRSTCFGTEGIEDIPDQAGRHSTDLVQREQWATMVAKVLTQLPSRRDREILVRYYLDDHGKEEICHGLGISDDHFRRVLFRARERFRSLLEEDGIRKLDLLSIALTLSCTATLLAGFAQWPTSGKFITTAGDRGEPAALVRAIPASPA